MRNKVIKIFVLAVLFVFLIASAAYADNSSRYRMGTRGNDNSNAFSGSRSNKNAVKYIERDEEDEDENEYENEYEHEYENEYEHEYENDDEDGTCDNERNQNQNRNREGSKRKGSQNKNSKKPAKDVAVTKVTLNKTSTSIAVGAWERLQATVQPSNAADQRVLWTSSNPRVASVNPSGKVTGIRVGTAKITVITIDGSKTASCTVEVIDDGETGTEVTGITLNKTSMTIAVGSQSRLTATVTPSDADNKTVFWFSDKPDVASVDQNGLVKGKTAGTADIYAVTQDGFKYTSCAVTVTSLVRNPIEVTAVSLDRTSLTLTAGDTDRLVATVTPDDATDKSVTWKSGNPSVVIVDQSGNIGALKAGTATVTVKTNDGGETAKCTVTVTAAASTVHVTSVVITQTSANITVATGSVKRLEATVLPGNATNKTLIWSSSNTSIAAVDQLGNVTGVSEGTATITVKTVDGGKTDTCTVHVIAPADWRPVTGVSLNLVNTTLPVGFSERLTYRIEPSGATNQEVTWSSSNPDVASVNMWGDVKGKSTGTAVITVKTADGSKTAVCYVTVMPAVETPADGILLNKIASTMRVGATEYPAVTVYPAGTAMPSLTWTSSNTAVATVGSTGKVTAVSPGTAVITVTTADNETASYIVMVI